MIREGHSKGASTNSLRGILALGERPATDLVELELAGAVLVQRVEGRLHLGSSTQSGAFESIGGAGRVLETTSLERTSPGLHELHPLPGLAHGRGRLWLDPPLPGPDI